MHTGGEAFGMALGMLSVLVVRSVLRRGLTRKVTLLSASVALGFMCSCHGGPATKDRGGGDRAGSPTLENHLAPLSSRSPLRFSEEADWEVLRYVSEALLPMGQGASRTWQEELVTALIQAVSVPDIQTDRRVAAMRALARLGAREGVPSIVASLSDSDCYIRRVAILALGDLRDVRAVDPLISSLQDSDAWAEEVILWQNNHPSDVGEFTGKPMTRVSNAMAAARSLGEIGSSKAVPALLEVVKARAADSALEGLCVAAATALGDMGDESALPFLRALSDRDQSGQVRVLGKEGNPRNSGEPQIRRRFD